MAEFKDRLRQLRTEKELSQQAVASALGFDKMTISGYENGKRHPRFETIDTLADFLDVDIGYLLGSSDLRKPYPRMTPEEQDRIGADLITIEVSSEELELVRAYRRLDAYGQKLTRMAAHVEKE